MKTPCADPRQKRLAVHGDERVDPYFWLRDRDNPDVLDYLNAENAYVADAMSETAQLQENIYAEIRGRIHESDQTAPYFDNGFWYYTRYEQGSEYPIHARRETTIDAPEQVLLDVSIMAQSEEFLSVSGLAVSPDNRKLAYFVDNTGRRQYQCFVLNLATGAVQDTGVANASPGAEWSADSETLVFIKNDADTLRARTACRFSIVENRCDDFFDEADETYSLYVDKTRSDEFLMLLSVSTVATECQLMDATDVAAEPVLFYPRQRDHEYFVDHDGQTFFVCSNHQARNFRLLSTTGPGQSLADWHEVVAHRDDVLFEDFMLFEKYLIIEQMRNGLKELEVHVHADGTQFLIPFDEPAYAAGVGDNCTFRSTVLRFEYESMTTPPSVIDFDLSTRQSTLIKQDPVLGNFLSSDYVCERLMLTVRDGADVPVSLVYQKGLDRSAPAPMLLYAYGSYGYSIEPAFSYSRLSLLDRGFIFAIAHVRGGSDLGRSWYEDGKLAKKQNTFNDFADVARGLMAASYTAADRLYAMGGSAGGLLMGVIANEAGDDFAGIVAAVPFVDVVTTMLDESIPLTTGEYDEWGDPNNADAYKTMLAYSPYDNVEAKDYPPMLVTSGLHDSQVQYWEPTKWVAKLRAMKTDSNLLLLRTNMDAGHGGASGRFEALRETALEYAFLLLLESRRTKKPLIN